MLQRLGSSSISSHPQRLLAAWREERSCRVGKLVVASGLMITPLAAVADFFFSAKSVFATDIVLFFACVLSLGWIWKNPRQRYFWVPAYVGLYISTLPTLWTTGGLQSPFLGLVLTVLFVIGSVLDPKNWTGLYLAGSAGLIAGLISLEHAWPVTPLPVVPIRLIVAITILGLAAVAVGVRAILRTEQELSREFAKRLDELAQAQEELKQREAQLREAQEIAHVGSWEWDLETDRVSWSDEMYSIFQADKNTFTPTFQAVVARLAPSAQKEVESNLPQILSKGDSFSMEYCTADQQQVIVSYGRTVKNEAGKVVKLIGTCHDITARVRIEEKLRKAQAELEERVEERTRQLAESLLRERSAKELAEKASHAKMQFLAHMSHEIRTPMNSILGFSELIAADPALSDVARDYLGRVRANGVQLMHLIDDILDLSKFEAGKIPIERTWISLKSLVDDVIQSFQPTVKRKGIALDVTFKTHGLGPVLADGGRVRQILSNLVGNAVKFTERGKVQVSVYAQKMNGHSPHEASRVGIPAVADGADDRSVQIVMDVEDTGPGISLGSQGRLFESFSQGDSWVARRFGGTGLGLALSRHIATALGGRLELVHSSVGVGSCFRFEFRAQTRDLIEPRAHQAGDSNSSPATECEFSGRRILIADDTTDNALLIHRYLAPLGPVIDIVQDGTAAVKAAAERPYDCILMDIQMPIMDGLEATKRIRSQGYKGPIVALTAHALASEAQKSMAAGCSFHLTKPVNSVTLVNAMRTQMLASGGPRPPAESGRRDTAPQA